MYRTPGERLLALSTQLDDLATRSIQPWLEAGLDPQGGAYGFLDRFFVPRFSEPGGPRGPSEERRGDQSLVQQARHLFAYSFLHGRRPQADPRLADFAHHLYAHLLLGFSRSASGQTQPGKPRQAPFSEQLSQAESMSIARPLLHWVPRGGGWGSLPDPGPAHDWSEQAPYGAGSVQLYAQGFAIYALCTYAQTFGASDASRQALELFELLDAERHDRKYGGYDQTSDGGWMPFVSAPKGAAKCTNTHIHLLEALTPLCRCFPQQKTVLSRLKELARLISETLLQPSGYVHKFFARDGAPLGPAEVSYGHDLETSWLLLDASDALDEAGALDVETKGVVLGASRRMAEHALRTGWDQAGGVFDSGIPEGAAEPPRVTGPEKVWWAQAESLPGLFRLYQQSAEPSLLDRLEETFVFLSEKSWDAEGGEYFWGVDSQGNPAGRGVHKGEMWKTPYHALRACILTADWIRQSLERAG